MRSRKTALFLGLLLLFCQPVVVIGEMRPAKKIRAGIPPFQVIEKIMQGNQLASADKQAPGKLSTPYLTWLTDSDAGIQTQLILGDARNKVYGVRNMGNQLELSIGAIDYGIRHLHTPVLLITSNSGNQAIRLFMEGYTDIEPSIRRDLDHLHQALASAKNTDAAPKEFAEAWLTKVEQNVDYQVNRALARYEDRVRNGRLVVVGSVLDLTNQYGHGNGKLIIINVNGEQNAEKIKKMNHMVRLDKQLLTRIGRKRAAKKSPPPGSAKQ